MKSISFVLSLFLIQTVVSHPLRHLMEQVGEHRRGATSIGRPSSDLSSRALEDTQDDVCVSIVQRNYGPELCECEVRGDFYDLNCEGLCEICEVVDEPAGEEFCTEFANYFSTYTLTGVGIAPVSVSYSYLHGEEGVKTNFTYLESSFNCEVYIDGEMCSLCQLTFACADGLAVVDCTNIEGIDQVYDDCDATAIANVGTEDPFYAFATLDTASCVRDHPKSKEEESTDAPTGAPSEAMSISPSNAPTSPVLTNAPSGTPSEEPTGAPSLVPSKAPTGTPSHAPTMSPSDNFSSAPSGDVFSPAPSGGLSSPAPTGLATVSPTKAPTMAPTKAPTKAPTMAPTKAPTPPTDASPNPTMTPSDVGSTTKTLSPTPMASMKPSVLNKPNTTEPPPTPNATEPLTSRVTLAPFTVTLAGGASLIDNLNSGEAANSMGNYLVKGMQEDFSNIAGISLNVSYFEKRRNRLSRRRLANLVLEFTGQIIFFGATPPAVEDVVAQQRASLDNTAGVQAALDSNPDIGANVTVEDIEVAGLMTTPNPTTLAPTTKTPVATTPEPTANPVTPPTSAPSEPDIKSSARSPNFFLSKTTLLLFLGAAAIL